MNIKEKIFDVQNFEELYRNLYIQFISMLYVLQLIKNYKEYILGDIRFYEARWVKYVTCSDAISLC